jgi:hypothetical protein
MTDRNQDAELVKALRTAKTRALTLSDTEALATLLSKAASRIEQLIAEREWRPDREAVAKIIDPIAFRSWQQLYDFCLSQDDGEENARRYADDTHGPSMIRALAKADRILALPQSPSKDTQP